MSRVEYLGKDSISSCTTDEDFPDTSTHHPGTQVRGRKIQRWRRREVPGGAFTYKIAQ